MQEELKKKCGSFACWADVKSLVDFERARMVRGDLRMQSSIRFDLLPVMRSGGAA